MIALRVRRAALASVLALVAGSSLAACGGAEPPPTDVVGEADLVRAAALQAEPVLKGAVDVPIVEPGKLISDKLGWDRTQVRARVFVFQPGASGGGLAPAAMETAFDQVVMTLRSSGWSVYWALCAPPPVFPAGGGPPAPVPLPPDVDRVDGFQWVSFAYKIDKGVSYWAQVSAVLDDQIGNAWIDMLLRAPEESDPDNLFTDTPKQLVPGKSCMDDHKVGTAVEQSGTLTYLRDWHPFPAQSHSPDPIRR